MLLHLLQIGERENGLRRLLGALDQYAPILGDGHFAVEGWRGFAGFNLHGDVKLAFGFAAEDAMSGRNIGIVAAHGGAQVTMMGDQVVGGVEAHPTQMGHERLNPGVRSVGRGAVVVVAAAVEIAGDIARRDADMAQQRDHGVGKVLANALAADDGFVDR